MNGIPPTVGFFGKMYVFNAGIRADLTWLVLIGVVNALLSAFYYLGIVRQMFLGDAEGASRVVTTPSIGLALSAAVLGVLVFGIYPTPLLDAARDAANVFAVR